LEVFSYLLTFTFPVGTFESTQAFQFFKTEFLTSKQHDASEAALCPTKVWHGEPPLQPTLVWYGKIASILLLFGMVTHLSTPIVVWDINSFPTRSSLVWKNSLHPGTVLYDETALAHAIQAVNPASVTIHSTV
jgi:hypothetical protein